MKFHPLQHDQNALAKLSMIFREAMEKHEVLPKNPWRAKRLKSWLAKFGGRMEPESRHFRTAHPVDCGQFVNFRVACPKVQNRIKGYREERWSRIEIPWELAEKVLALGFVP